MSPAVVCLDAADTLFTERASRPALYAEVFASFGVSVPEPTLAGWMARAHDEVPAPLGGEPRYSRGWFREFVGRLLRRAGADRDPEPVRAALEEVFTDPRNYLVFGDTFPALDDLVEAGHRLAVVSNWSDRLEGLLDALGLRRYFETLAVSAVVGVDKPDPALFHHALDRLGVRPEQALHVGDHPERDVGGALAAGMDALLLDRAAEPPLPGHVLRSLEELPARLRGR